MDPGGSELDASLPQADTPCLIVEDSQPDSVALEDDPDGGYRTLLARRLSSLSSLQPAAARSPVLELISSPLGSRCSQTDSQSNNNSSQAEPEILSSACEEQSQVISVCSLPTRKKCLLEEAEMDSGADSTTHCVPSDGASSQFGFLMLSQSQDLRDGEPNSQDGAVAPQSDGDRRSKSAEQNRSSRASESQDHKAARSEVSSSSSAAAARRMNVQMLLHSQNLQESQEAEEAEEVLSSQQDLFDNDKSGTAVDSTVREAEQAAPGGGPTCTPAHSLRLLHLSGQGTLVQESLSQSSVDFVAPTQDGFGATPIIVPSSPTGPENGADEPMDTSLPADDGEPMETEPASKPHPAASTPISQNSPAFMSERPLSVPSQPQFSHDVFVATQSQEATPSPLPSSPRQTPSQKPATPSSSLPSQLPEEKKEVQKEEEVVEEDSQATQIDDLEEESSSGVDASDSAISCRDKKEERNAESAKGSSSSQASSLSQKCDSASLNVPAVNVKEAPLTTAAAADDPTANSCVLQTPCGSAPSSQAAAAAADVVKSSLESRGESEKPPSVGSPSQQGGAARSSQQEAQEEEVVMEEEVLEEEQDTTGGSGLALVISQSQLLTPEPMEEEVEEEVEQERSDAVVIVTDSQRNSQVYLKDATPSPSPPSKSNASQNAADKTTASTNGHQPQEEEKEAEPERRPQGEKAGGDADDLKDKSLSDSSGDISFHFTLPKDGELMGAAVGATPPLISQLKQTLRQRHSTPIEITSFSQKSGDVSSDGGMAGGGSVDVAAGGGSVEDGADKGDGKLSLRMKLVTPVEEGSPERFSLQKPTLSQEDGAVVKVTSPSSMVTSSPSVFSRVRQVHRQQQQQQQQEEEEEEEEGGPPGENSSHIRGELFASPPRGSQTSSLGCSSLPNSQSAPAQQEAPRETAALAEAASGERRGAPDAPPQPSSNVTNVRQKAGLPLSFEGVNTPTQSRKRPSFDTAGLRSPTGRGEPETPSFRRAPVPSHRRHVRTIQEVRTTVTRIITDVYYEDGKEVERKVTEENEEPVVDCQVLDSDISPCRTGSSSVTSGDLADISSLSSKASSLQHSSGGTSSSAGFSRPDFVMPPSRGLKPARGGGASSLQRLAAHGLHHPHSSSDDEGFAGTRPPPRLPVSPAPEPDSLRSSPEEAGSAGSSFVGLRVVAKWSSNGYFYSGRIISDAGEGQFRLRFDDGYECEVAGKDVLLCDPIPVETEVTALLEDEYFSIGMVKGHKMEGQDLFYSVERDGATQWYNRTSVILSLEQGNKLREQHSLGPYEPSAPLAKASDISLDNLVEGKRRRRGAPGGQTTPNRPPSSSSSPRTPGPSGKRKLMSSDGGRSPPKRGRRGAGARAAQRVGACNTSGSGTDLPAQPAHVADTHGPLPQNSSLFMGFAFMLTASSEVDRLTNKIVSDEEEDYVETGPYNKGYTESQLQAGGGFILPDFNEEQCKAAYQSLLVADQHCRTRKYLLCVASGVPCVSHLWVRDCCKDNKLLNYRNYLLPAGVGPDDAIVEWHPRCSPFKAMRVLLVFEKPVELWAQLITMGGGASVRHFHADKDSSDVPAGKYDVVVADGGCPAPLEQNATSQKVPLVSPEWLIQSLICGERLDVDKKPQYRHNFSSSTSSTSSSS
ncbi:unnamed protein product [Ophioblennius macclurei]